MKKIIFIVLSFFIYQIHCQEIEPGSNNECLDTNPKILGKAITQICKEESEEILSLTATLEDGSIVSCAKFLTEPYRGKQQCTLTSPSKMVMINRKAFFQPGIPKKVDSNFFGILLKLFRNK